MQICRYFHRRFSSYWVCWLRTRWMRLQFGRGQWFRPKVLRPNRAERVRRSTWWRPFPSERPSTGGRWACWWAIQEALPLWGWKAYGWCMRWICYSSALAASPSAYGCTLSKPTIPTTQISGTLTFRADFGCGISRGCFGCGLWSWGFICFIGG